MATVITPSTVSSINVSKLRKDAENRMEKGAFGYYASGATDEYTLRENSLTFQRLQILCPPHFPPKDTVSRDTETSNNGSNKNNNVSTDRYQSTDRSSSSTVSSSTTVDTSSSILGYSTSFPLGVAPCAFHKLADKDYGEIHTARGIAKADTAVCWSTFGTCSIYDVCQTIYTHQQHQHPPNPAAKGVRYYEPPCFFQLYWLKDKDLTRRLIQHAAAAGCKAVVLTVDRPVLGKREIDLRAKFDLPPGMECPNVMNGKKYTPNYRHYWETIRGVPMNKRKRTEEKKNTEETTIRKGTTDFEGSFYLTAQVEDTLTWTNLQDLRQMINESCDQIKEYYRDNYEDTMDTFVGEGNDKHNSSSSSSTEAGTVTPMAIILKGILTYEDAYASVVYGSDAVWVSNHGGRQLDTVLSGLDALPEVVAGVRAAEADIRSGNLANLPYKGLMTTNTKGSSSSSSSAGNGTTMRDTEDKLTLLPSGRLRTEVYVDGGVTTGADVFKCVALGADYVFLARPILWALAVGGDTLVYEYLQQIRNELRDIMEQCSIPDIEHITLDYLGENKNIINSIILSNNGGISGKDG